MDEPKALSAYRDVANAVIENTPEHLLASAQKANDEIEFFRAYAALEKSYLDAQAKELAAQAAKDSLETAKLKVFDPNVVDEGEERIQEVMDRFIEEMKGWNVPPVDPKAGGRERPVPQVAVEEVEGGAGI